MAVRASTENVVPSESSAAFTADDARMVAHAFAPVFYQPSASPRRDFPVAVDFDGDLVGRNNEESLASDLPLEAAVYAAVRVTDSHAFIVYSLFHPLDHDRLPSIIPYAWHENDMESVLVVVDLGAWKPVLVITQAHFWTHAALERARAIQRSQALERSRALVCEDEEGYRTPQGRHAVVFLEAGGHGMRPGRGNPPKGSMRFFPSNGDRGDLHEEGKADFRYRLISTNQSLWRWALEGRRGDGELFDGSFDYRGERISYRRLPRYFDSDRISGPGKADAGILPFAFAKTLLAADLGSYFFDPAHALARRFPTLGISLQYRYDPFALTSPDFTLF